MQNTILGSLSAGRMGRKQIAVIIAAGMLSAGGAGALLTWSASANERPVEPPTAAQTVSSIDVDSLYTAIAAEAPTFDSSYAEAVAPRQTISGRVSWYGPGFHGRRTASGERFDSQEMTAAHKTLPFGTIVRVVDDRTGRNVLVRVNDRGPYCGGRVMDLSEGAAQRLGIRGSGTASVRLEIYGQVNASRIANDSAAAPSETAFDAGSRLVRMNGYSVVVAGNIGFEQALELQRKLNSQGYENVYVAREQSVKGSAFRVYVGLFSSNVLCESLMTELSDTYKSAEVIRFRNGNPVRTHFAGNAAGVSAPM